MYSLITSSSNCGNSGATNNYSKSSRSSSGMVPMLYPNEYHDDNNSSIHEKQHLIPSHTITSMEDQDDTTQHKNDESIVSYDDVSLLVSSPTPNDAGDNRSDDPQWDQLESLLRRDCVYNNITNLSHSSALNRYGGSPSSQQFDSWRKKMCLWSFRVVDHWRYDRHTVAIAMNLLDRYLITLPQDDERNRNNRQVSQSEYQLTSMTCLYLAMKLNAEQGHQPEQHSDQPPQPQPYHSDHSVGGAGATHYSRRTSYMIRLSSFVDLSRGQFQSEDICRMEQRILQSLQWQVHPVIPADVASVMLQNVWTQTNIGTPAYHALEELVSYICELSILHFCGSQWRPYHMACASILFAMEFFTEPALPMRIRSYVQLLFQSAIQVAESNNNRSCGSVVPVESSSRSGDRYTYEDDAGSNDSWIQIHSLQSILQSTLRMELIRLFEEETRNVYHPIAPHRDNPIAVGISLCLFDMDKLNHHIFQQPPTYGSHMSSSSSQSNSARSVMEGPEDHRDGCNATTRSFASIGQSPKRPANSHADILEDKSSPVSVVPIILQM